MAINWQWMERVCAIKFDQAVPLILDFKLCLVGSQKYSLMLVVSPVIALMVDQVTSLKKGSVYSSVVTSSDGIDKDFLATDRSLSTDSLPFFAPEALVQSKWRYCIDDAEVSQGMLALVFDEAHCVSRWQVTHWCTLLIYFCSNKHEMFHIILLYMYINCVVNAFLYVYIEHHVIINIQLGTQIRFNLYATLHRCILTGELCIPQCKWWAGCQRRCVDEVLGDKDDAADVLLLDIPDIYFYCKHSVYCIEWIKHKSISFLLSNYNLFLDSLDLGLSLTVSGETSISLNSSGQYELSPSVRVLHLEQICVGSPLSQTDTRSLLQQASWSK